MDEILKIVPKQTLNLKYYQEWHYSNLKIIDCFINLKKGDKIKSLKELDFISNLRYSYLVIQYRCLADQLHFWKV